MIMELVRGNVRSVLLPLLFLVIVVGLEAVETKAKANK